MADAAEAFTAILDLLHAHRVGMYGCNRAD